MATKCGNCMTAILRTKSKRRRRYCPSCEMYNAAVEAQQRAAQALAKVHDCDVNGRAWLNEYGVFAYRDGVCVQIGTPEMAAPFVALTSAALRVTAFAVTEVA